MNKSKLEIEREKMHKIVNTYGLRSKEALKQSQLVDKLILIAQKEINKNKRC